MNSEIGDFCLTIIAHKSLHGMIGSVYLHHISYLLPARFVPEFLPSRPSVPITCPMKIAKLLASARENKRGRWTGGAEFW